MHTITSKLAMLLLLTTFMLGLSSQANAADVKGIYLTQGTLEDTQYLNYLIERSKAVGINTFVIDLEKQGKLYQKNIALVKNSGIRYVARVIVFPDGGRPDQIDSPAYWAKRYALVQAAINYGAQEIQLDYIRYNTKRFASSDNSKHIFKVLEFFKEKTAAQHIPLQADVFGISSFGESKHIGQNLRLMAESVDALCPMVYPSHFEPFKIHAVTPYHTIYTSLKALQSQFGDKMPVKLYAYIEISNYRYSLPGEHRRNYIISELKAVDDAKADGYFVWSAHNKYDYLFDLLAKINKDPNILTTAKVDGGTKTTAVVEKPKLAENDEATTNNVFAETQSNATETISSKPAAVADATPSKKLEEADAKPATTNKIAIPTEMPTPQHHVFKPQTEISFNTLSKTDPLSRSLPQFGFHDYWID